MIEVGIYRKCDANGEANALCALCCRKQGHYGCSGDLRHGERQNRLRQEALL